MTGMTFTLDSAANALSALGHPVRLHIFRLLVKSGHEGLSVGEIGTHLGVPASTLAHHLTALVQTGLVEQERQGRTIINRARFGAMDGLIGFLSDECCAGVPGLINEQRANDNVA
jgi:DNA-binding transcriptional ArsR family regulator